MVLDEGEKWDFESAEAILRELAFTVLKYHHDLLKKTHARGMRKMVAEGIFQQLNEKEVDDEWDTICQSTKTPGATANPFFFFILSNILRRPIVMHGQEVYVRDDEQLVPTRKIGLRGIFLPSFIPPAHCYKTPIVVGWTCGDTSTHLASLVGYEEELSDVSLVDDNGKTLPVWFGIKDEREWCPCPETVLLDRYMELMWHQAPDAGKRYPLARMGAMKINEGDDAVMQTAKRVTTLFEKKEAANGRKPGGITPAYVETAEQAGSGVGVGDVRLEEAKRKREFDGDDEVELSRPSKKTLPSSPSVSADAALSVVSASPLAADVLSLPSPLAREPRVLLEAQRQNAAFAEGNSKTPDARRLKRRRLTTACLTAAACAATAACVLIRS